MHTLDFLNGKQVKEINELVKEQWGTELPKEYSYLIRKDGDIFLVDRGVGEIDLQKLRINSIGIYVGELRNDELRMSIEGAQIIGPQATKNVVKITREQLSQWLKGEDLEVDSENGFVILKCQKDFVGCGKASNGRILNFVPKARRVKVSA